MASVTDALLGGSMGLLPAPGSREGDVIFENLGIPGTYEGDVGFENLGNPMIPPPLPPDVYTTPIGPTLKGYLPGGRAGLDAFSALPGYEQNFIRDTGRSPTLLERETGVWDATPQDPFRLPATAPPGQYDFNMPVVPGFNPDGTPIDYMQGGLYQTGLDPEIEARIQQDAMLGAFDANERSVAGLGYVPSWDSISQYFQSTPDIPDLIPKTPEQLYKLRNDAEEIRLKGIEDPGLWDRTKGFFGGLLKSAPNIPDVPIWNPISDAGASTAPVQGKDITPKSFFGRPSRYHMPGYLRSTGPEPDTTGDPRVWYTGEVPGVRTDLTVDQAAWDRAIAEGNTSGDAWIELKDKHDTRRHLDAVFGTDTAGSTDPTLTRKQRVRQTAGDLIVPNIPSDTIRDAFVKHSDNKDTVQTLVDAKATKDVSESLKDLVNNQLFMGARDSGQGALEAYNNPNVVFDDKKFDVLSQALVDKKANIDQLDSALELVRSAPEDDRVVESFTEQGLKDVAAMSEGEYVERFEEISEPSPVVTKPKKVKKAKLTRAQLKAKAAKERKPKKTAVQKAVAPKPKQVPRRVKYTPPKPKSKTPVTRRKGGKPKVRRVSKAPRRPGGR